MSRRMTIVFDDEDLYTALKVEAARCHRPAKDIVAEALVMFFAASADAASADGQALRTAGAIAGNGGAVDALLRELGLQQQRIGARSN